VIEGAHHDEGPKGQKVIRNKIGLVELTKQLGNVSQACRIMGYSRDSFYRHGDTSSQVANLQVSRARTHLV
jgi:hypothetical protein